MLMDAYAVVTVQSGCSSTLALLASLVIRLFSMLVCLWCQRPQGAMRQLMFLGDFWGWGGLIKFIRTSTHTSCYATGRSLGLPHTPNQLHIHTHKDCRQDLPKLWKYSTCMLLWRKALTGKVLNKFGELCA